MKKPSNRTRVAERRNPKVPYANAHREHLERLLDRALADSFPASDPLGTLVPEVPPDESAASSKARRRR